MRKQAVRFLLVFWLLLLANFFHGQPLALSAATNPGPVIKVSGHKYLAAHPSRSTRLTRPVLRCSNQSWNDVSLRSDALRKNARRTRRAEHGSSLHQLALPVLVLVASDSPDGQRSLYRGFLNGRSPPET